jgi:formamidopyrimidine-DNA glycosylase
MIELPEAVSLAKQLDETIKRKCVVESNAGDSPHKWVFYKPPRDELTQLLVGKTIGDVTSDGRGIHIRMEPGEELVFDEFGGKLLYHDPDADLPKNYHLYLKFEDDSFLTLLIQMWGFISTRTHWEKSKWVIDRSQAIFPAGDTFTLERFRELFERYEDKEKDPLKTFFTNGKSVAGLGNAYLQDILFRAKLSPKKKVVEVTTDEQKALHAAVKETVEQAIEMNGRSSERDIFNNPGGYIPIMDKRAKDKPCPNCGTAIKKISYLGGSCYICPECQK